MCLFFVILWMFSSQQSFAGWNYFYEIASSFILNACYKNISSNEFDREVHKFILARVVDLYVNVKNGSRSCNAFICPTCFLSRIVQPVRELDNHLKTWCTNKDLLYYFARFYRSAKKCEKKIDAYQKALEEFLFEIESIINDLDALLQAQDCFQSVIIKNDLTKSMAIYEREAALQDWVIVARNQLSPKSKVLELEAFLRFVLIVKKKGTKTILAIQNNVDIKQKFCD